MDIDNLWDTTNQAIEAYFPKPLELKASKFCSCERRHDKTTPWAVLSLAPVRINFQCPAPCGSTLAVKPEELMYSPSVFAALATVSRPTSPFTDSEAPTDGAKILYLAGRSRR